MLSIKGENLITWWWSAQNSYMQARVTYLSGKSFLCEVWNTFIFLKKKKINYHILYKYFLLPSWCLHNYADLAPPFFFWKPIFFLSHISILKLPHPCFFDRVCRMQKVLIFPRWQTYGVKLFLETIYLTKRNKIASACWGLNLGPLVYSTNPELCRWS